MALTKCPECETEIADKTTVCKQCGCPIKQQRRIQKRESPFLFSTKVLLTICASILVIIVAIILVSNIVEPKHDIYQVALVDMDITVDESTGSEAAEAIDQLSDSEQRIFDALIAGINIFHNPSSVRILGIGPLYWSDEKTTAFPLGSANITIDISATNKMGGTVKSRYDLALKSYTHVDDETGAASGISKGDMLDISDFSIDPISPDRDVNIAKLNEALKTHWENLGVS